MKNILYVVAAILVIAWLFGYFAFHFGAIIHVLLVIAVVIILLKAIRGNHAL
ncbi:MAG: lmo0937 family membrane protein [Chitinophagales bacterium]